jgi:hypothetical protein
MIQKSAEYMLKRELLQISRLEMARSWVIIVCTYFVLRASLLLYPQWGTYEEPRVRIFVGLQTAIQVITGGVTAITFWKKDLIKHIVWVVFLQALEMVLSNFNRYKRHEHINFEGLNMLHTVFGVMFLIYNTFIGHLIIEDHRVSYLACGFLWMANIITILSTTFKFDGMSTECIISVIIAMIYMCILVPSFMYITNYINSEH